MRKVSALAAGAAVSVLSMKHAPRGWNSWDSYAGWINGDGDFGNAPQADVLQAASYMAEHLLQYGWDTVVIDEGWAWASPTMEVIDDYGRPYPNQTLYPSSADGNGFLNLSTQIHSLGLKFGVWTLRGMPRAATAKPWPIFNSPYTTQDAIGPTDCNCEWSDHMVATNAPSPAALAYYDSMGLWYSQQGIDFVKIDCMFPTQPNLPQHTEELIAFTAAFNKYGVEVSLSPGGLVSLGNASFIASQQLAATYRVTQDFWDMWSDNGPSHWPTGLASKMDSAAAFAPFFGANGTWPDLDMLPLGRIMHYQNGKIVGPPSESWLTPNQQQLVINLWCITGSPMFLGSRLPLLPNETFLFSLLTNMEALRIHDEATARTPLLPTSGGVELLQYAWSARVNTTTYILLINADPYEQEIDVNLADANLPGGITYCAFDLWNNFTITGTFNTSFWHWIPGQASGLYRIEVCRAIPLTLTIDVDAQWRNVSDHLFSAFLENLNHGVEGGLSAEMVQDYQCQQQVEYAQASLQSVSSPGFYAQQCQQGVFASSTSYAQPFDATWQLLQPGLTGMPGTLSLLAVGNSQDPGGYWTLSGTGQLVVTAPNFTDPLFNLSSTFLVNYPSAPSPYLVTLQPLRPGFPPSLLQTQQFCDVSVDCPSFVPAQCISIRAVANATVDDTTTWLLGPGLSVGQPWHVSTALGANVTVVSDTAPIPINTNTSTALRVDMVSLNAFAAPLVGVCNSGFWGMRVVASESYNASFFALLTEAERSLAAAGGIGGHSLAAFVSLESASGSIVYATSDVPITTGTGGGWAAYSVLLEAVGSDINGTARLCIRVPAPAAPVTLWLKGMSCMPSDTFMGHGMRPDIAQYIADLHPPVMRFPGGTYIDGMELTDVYNFSRTVGDWITRPGHNNFWGYISEDLVGFYEYLQFVEDIGAEGVWVVNAGFSVNEHVAGDALQPFVDQAVNGLHFALAEFGSGNYWAELRARMGHPDPFPLTYIAIGNENCVSGPLQDVYVRNYAVIYAAVKAAYPLLPTIANCDLTAGGTNHTVQLDYYDLHVYPGLVDDFIQLQYSFDAYARNDTSPRVFNSEYATIGEPEFGSLGGAIGEAVWMVGLERNSDVVPMAAYAPLLANTHDYHWQTDAINFNSTVSFGTPSYWNQRLFATNSAPGAVLLAFNATVTLATDRVAAAPFAPGVPLLNNVPSLSVSATLAANGDVVLKLVNYGGNPFHVSLSLFGSTALQPSTGYLSVLTGSDAREGNTLDAPEQVAIVESVVSSGVDDVIVLPPTSICVLRLPGVVSMKP